MGQSAVISEDIPVSALLPVKNGEKYLGELIPNIVDMLGIWDEFIIINDGSTDLTQTIIEQFASAEKRIRVLSTTGIGLVSALNLGVETAVNPWIARFDVDDHYSPERLSVQRKLISNSVAVIFSDYSFSTSAGNEIGVVHSAILPSATILSLVSSQRTAHPVALINREFLLKAGGYSKDDYPAEDLGLWLRICEFGELITSPNILLKYSLNISSVSNQNRKKQICQKDQLVKKWSGWQKAYENSLTEIENTTKFYLEATNGYQRLFLHFRDMYLVSKIIGRSFSKLKSLKKLGVLVTLKVAFSAIPIFYWAFLRKLYRKIR